MLLQDFDFYLPKSSIALRPASPRDSARLLSVDPHGADPLSECRVRELTRFLRSGDVLVFNNTKVLPAELQGRRLPRTGDASAIDISLTLVERLPSGAWKALARPGRRLREGDRIALEKDGRSPDLTVASKGEEGEIIVVADSGASIDILMEKYGTMPLPPYIARTRPVDDRDRTDYQTVYARAEGAVAAPTAGLHFTPSLLESIAEKGVTSTFVTLHVGAGTFLPVKSDNIEDHRIHAEWCEISEESADIINAGREEGGRVIAIGTTSLRLLETAAREDGSVRAYRDFTNLFVKPGYRFRIVDLLFTNFHLPKSTLFMLVCAFAGTPLMKNAYAHAVEAGFRFYSYGDACLLGRAAEKSCL